MLQGRLFNYGDTHRYRLGINNTQLPVNCPFRVNNYQRDGQSTLQSQGGAPVYHPNSFNGPEEDKRAADLTPVLPLSGDARRTENNQDDNFTQPSLFYRRVLKPDARGRLIENIISWLKYANTVIQERTVASLANVDQDFAERIKDGIRSHIHPHVDL